MIEAETARRIKDALFGQRYNLLLGAGVSLDAKDRQGNLLKGAEDLRKTLCTITDSRESSPLWRVAGLLSPDQVDTYLTKPYLGSKAGPTLQALTRFAWRTAFTLNIDDALENAYESNAGRLQTLIPVNYVREYETFRNPQELPLIHLHGSVRLPQDKYVFSLQEYAAVQRGMNPWVHALSSLIISEPFLIAGTSLFEPDLEYFLAYRPSNSTVISRAPSILIEPFPDAGTRRDCDRLNLVLVEATLEDFLSWLFNEFGIPPTPLALREPVNRPRVTIESSVFSRAAFWSDFEFVQALDHTFSKYSEEPSAFAFGRSPSWDDIRDKRDVPLQQQLQLIDEIRRWQVSNDSSCFVCLTGYAGSGKSTSIKRIATELVTHSLQVFYIKAQANFDVVSAVEFLSGVEDPIVLVTESLAEHGEQLVDLVHKLEGIRKICVFGSERNYRMRLVKDILADVPNRMFDVETWRIEERDELIRRYASMGVIGNSEAISSPRSFATKLIHDTTVAESVCRILNDFRPLRTIVRSLWNDTFAEGRAVYLLVSLAYYCHPVGIRSDIVSALYQSELLDELSLADTPLRICTNIDDHDYLVPANSTLSTLLIEALGNEKPKRLLDFVVQLANGLAPFVTRLTIKQRTPEARLAGRLFDADGVIPEILKEEFNSFYELTHEHWKWNSRYWEQRALWIGAKDRNLSIQHARHAVSIERHPFSMTTLAKLLFAAIFETKPPKLDYFSEAITLMEETIRIESNWARGRTHHAYWVLMDGVFGYINTGGIIINRELIFIERAANDALRIFNHDSEVYGRAREVLSVLNSDDD